ncbi:glycosyltransferase family 2 protein [Flavivirga sp. 57AJ16]|uniref:glycosyltransferase family 2 protein n=1 Tax=Flavivirga sp. 57AJ16 TaxID=3025307 RepID=UPI0023651EC5|nr:glycosyltransferase family 2 protein [Flavivirga sp. 57AJ16]MDD7885827.1 glycosyltransferase family 2 protein [Flavivirga sp. 57AJ16]
MIKASIIIPMYNVAQYLDKCVKSIIAQNLKPGTFEVIMINDDSPDNSLEIATNLSKQYNFISIISQKNKGLGGARNTGIQNAKGDYIIFLDADDWLISNSVENIIKISDKHKLDILEFGAHLVAESGETVNTISRSSNEIIYNGIEYYNTIKYAGSACNKLYSRAFLQTNNLLFLEKIFGEDFEFNTRALFFAKRILAVENVCAAFLQSSNSITRNNDRAKKDKYLIDFTHILSSIRDFRDRYSHTNQSESVSSFFNERLTMVNINAFYLMFKNNYSFNEINKYKKTLKEKKLFYIKYPVAIKKKELFRKVMLKNFFLFRPAQLLKRALNTN